MSSPAPSAENPVTLYWSSRFDLPSQITGRTYRIFVFRPPVPPPPSGYPVFTLTDANIFFPIAAGTGVGYAFGGHAPLIVGVGYPVENPMEFAALRTLDLTPPTPLEGIRQDADKPPVKTEDYGGAENFYRFLVEELRPAIAAAYPVNAGDQTLFGHSWGGMFTTHVLLNHPESFRTFIASSPSLWWNNRAVLKDEAGFARKVAAKKAAPRVFIMVGADEEAAKPAMLPAHMKTMSMKEIKKKMDEWRMVGNARDLARRLKRLKGKRPYEVRFLAFKDEDHATVVPAAISRALAFSFLG